jgi:hypothetical protein
MTAFANLYLFSIRLPLLKRKKKTKGTKPLTSAPLLHSTTIIPSPFLLLPPSLPPSLPVYGVLR